MFVFSMQHSKDGIPLPLTSISDERSILILVIVPLSL